MRAKFWMTAAVSVLMAMTAVVTTGPSLAAPSTASSPVPPAVVCLPDLELSSLDTLFDSEPGGVVGADYQRALALPDGRVLWTFQDAAFRTGPDDIVVVHNIAMLQDDACFTVLHGGSRSVPESFFFADRTVRFERWFWPLDAAIGDDGRVYVYAAEMAERSDDYLTETVPVGTWVAVFDPASGRVVDETRPPNASADLYGWSITSDERWTYLYAQCYRQFGFDEYAFVAAFDRSCSTDITVARVPRGKLFDPLQYWDGGDWQPDAGRARSIITANGRRINANQFEWTGERFVSVNKEGDWWGDTIYLAESASARGPFRVYDEIAAPVKCAACNSFFATFVPGVAARRAGDRFVISLAHNRWDGVVTSLYRPTFHAVKAPTHLPAGATFELSLPPGTAAAAINVAVVDPHLPGFVTAFPCGDGLPLASNVNHVNEPVVSNLVLARPDAQGRVCLYSLAETNLVVDLAGTFGTDDAFEPVSRPVRLVDTRSGDGAPARRIEADGVLRFEVPPSDDGDRSAVALNVVAVEPSDPGFLTVYSCDRDRPETSNVNYVSEPVVSNLVVLPADAGSDVCVYSLAETDLVVDFVGTFASGAYAPLDDAVRLIDTRVPPAGRVAAGGIVEVAVPANSSAAMLNVIAVEPSGPGFLTVYPCDREVPTASNVNFVTTPVVSNLVIARPSADDRVCVYTSIASDIVIDLAGVLDVEADYDAPVTPVRLVDTRIGTGVVGQFGRR